MPHLSLDHGGKLFRIKIVGTGTLRDGRPFTQVVYTEPFEVVSKVEVVDKASKRRTSEQVREDARKRAKAKAGQSATSASHARLNHGAAAGNPHA